MSKLYVLVLGLSEPFDKCRDALALIGVSFRGDERAELWELGSHQAVFIGALTGTPVGMLTRRFAEGLRHPNIESAMLIPAEDASFAKARDAKSIQNRIDARLREMGSEDLTLTRRPTQRSSRRVRAPAAGPPAAKG